MVNSIVIDTIHWRHFWLFIGISLSMLWDAREKVKHERKYKEVRVIGGYSLTRDLSSKGATEATKGKERIVAINEREEKLMKEREIEEALRVLENALKDELNQGYSLRGGLR